MSGSGPRWAGNLLREAALRASQEAGFWDQPSGQALVQQLTKYVSPQIARQVRATLGYPLEAEEVTNTIIVEMSSSTAFPVGLRRSVNPWGYLAECARRWAWAQASHRVLDLERLIGVEAVGSSVDELFDPPHGLTRLEDVVAATAAILLDYTAGAAGAAGVGAAVEWLANNPPQHQGHGHQDARNAPELRSLGLSAAQVGVLARVTWGGRPDLRATSLFYGFLMDSGFTPEASRTHRVALTNVRRVFAQEGR